MSMVGEVRRAEDHYAVENRQYLGLALFHVAIPKLQFSAVFLAPILVQIKQQIQTPIQTVVAMAVEVRMHAQLAPRHDLMQSTALEPWIGNEIIDAGHLADEIQEGIGIQVIHEQSRHRPKGGFGGRCQFDLLGAVEFLPSDGAGLWKFRENSIDDVRIEEIVEDHVRKRLRLDVSRIRRSG